MLYSVQLPAPSLGREGGRLTPQAVRRVSPGAEASALPRGVRLASLSAAAQVAPGLPGVLLSPGPGWLCSFGVFPVCLSVCHSACAEASLSTSPGRPGHFPGPQGPRSAQPPGQGSHFGARAGCSRPGPAIPARPLPTPGERRPAASAGQRPAGRDDMYLLLEAEKQGVRRP